MYRTFSPTNNWLFLSNNFSFYLHIFWGSLQSERLCSLLYKHSHKSHSEFCCTCYLVSTCFLSHRICPMLKQIEKINCLPTIHVHPNCVPLGRSVTAWSSADSGPGSTPRFENWLFFPDKSKVQGQTWAAPVIKGFIEGCNIVIRNVSVIRGFTERAH